MSGGKNRRLKNPANAVSFGYVIIPTDVDRDEYINTCLRTGRVSVMTEGGVFCRDIYVTNECFENIEFPLENGAHGTAVVIASNPYTGTPIIIGTYPRNDESRMRNQEDMYMFRKTFNDTTVSLLLDSHNKSAILNVSSSTGGIIKVSSTGSTDSIVTVDSSGTVEVKADEKAVIKSFTEVIAEVQNPDPEKIENEVRRIKIDLNEASFEWSKSNDQINRKFTVNDDQVNVQIGQNVAMTVTDEQLDANVGQSTVKVTSDLIEFNGGGLDGLVKINELTQKLNQLVQEVTQCTTVFNAHQHTVQVTVPAGTGSTVALTGATMTAPSQFNASDYKNEKITQG